MSAEEGYISCLAKLDAGHRLRRVPADDLPAGMVDLSSNDYLGLGMRSGEFMEEFRSRYGDAAFSSCASRLLSTRQSHHRELESKLEGLYSRKALLFNSGYHANTGCISALAEGKTLFVCDKLVHASIVDGLRIGNCDFVRYPHNDFEKLTRIVSSKHADYERLIIVTESIFSMDGDEAPLERIVELKRTYPNVMIYLDEAHAFGVRGDRGLGISEEKGLINDIDILIVTFGKACASSGAAAICSRAMREYLVNCSRSFIFSTALPPACSAWTLLMIEKIEEMRDERKHLAELSEEFSNALESISQRNPDSTSQIIPYLTGDAAKALSLAARLRDNGFLALPIRRPTVPPGGERIRFSLNASLSADIIPPLIDLLTHEA